MLPITSNKKPQSNFIIENNIIKGENKIHNVITHNIGELILKSFNDNPDHVAQIDAKTDKRITFNEMKENSIRCALWIQKQGIGNNDVIAICTHHHLDAYIPYIGTLLTGAIYNPWYHEVSLKTARHLISLTKPKLIFACKSAVAVLQEAARFEKIDTKIIVYEGYSELQSLKDITEQQTNEEVQAFKVPTIKDQEAISMILFTSGTAGMPKGVAHSHKSIIHIATNFMGSSGNNSMKLWYSSLYWASGTFNTLQSILTQTTRIVHADFDPVETCKVLEKYKIDWFFIIPTMATQWSKSEVLKSYKLNSLKVLLTGGAKLSRKILDEIQRHLPNTFICQAFGMTEIGGPALAQTKESKKRDSVGFVTSNVELKVIDVDTDDALGPNQPGELCVKSPTTMIGYYQNPTATMLIIDKEGWLHTGDKVYYNEDGEFFIVDRIKEVMKFRQHHISPLEIEEILLSHPAVEEAAVVPVPHEVDIEHPMAFVKTIPNSMITENELIELTSTLGEYKKLWGGVKFLKEIPLTGSGKIDRNKLKEMAKMYSS